MTNRQSRKKCKPFGIPGIMRLRVKEIDRLVADMGGELPDDERGRKMAQVMAHVVRSRAASTAD
jgi:hypothetical protein